MKFLGNIERIPCVDYFAYYKSMREQSHKIVLTSDFGIDNCFEIMALVYGKFGNDFCSGENPLHIQENGTVEVAASIEVSYDLLKRLELDNESSSANLLILKRELDEG